MYGIIINVNLWLKCSTLETTLQFTVFCKDDNEKTFSYLEAFYVEAEGKEHF